MAEGARGGGRGGGDGWRPTIFGVFLTIPSSKQVPIFCWLDRVFQSLPYGHLNPQPSVP